MTFDGNERDALLGGNLLVGQAVELSHQENVARAFGQGTQHGLNAAKHFKDEHAGFRRGCLWFGQVCQCFEIGTFNFQPAAVVDEQAFCNVREQCAWLIAQIGRQTLCQHDPHKRVVRQIGSVKVVAQLPT